MHRSAEFLPLPSKEAEISILLLQFLKYLVSKQIVLYVYFYYCKRFLINVSPNNYILHKKIAYVVRL